MKLKLPNRYVIFLMSVITFIILSGCSDSDAMREMDRADAVIDEHPDSALTILSAIDPTTLRTREGKARHSLLLSLSMIKVNGLSDTAKSIFSTSFDFYKKRNRPSRENMLAHFMQAYLLDSAALRLKEYDKAIELAAGKGKWDYIALAHFNKASIYGDESSNADELESVEEGNKYLDSVGRADVRAFAIEITGLTYLGNERYRDAEIQFEKLLEISEADHDSLNINVSHTCLGSAYALLGNYEDAVSHFDYVMDHADNGVEFSSNALLHYSLSLIHTGRLDDAWNLIRYMDDSVEPSERVGYYSALAAYHAARGDYQKAYALTDSLIENANSSIMEKLQFSLPRQEKKMEIELAEANRIAQERKSTINILTTLFMGITLILMIIIILYRNKMHRLRVGIISRELLEKENENKILCDDLSSYEEKDKELELRLQQVGERIIKLEREKNEAVEKLRIKDTAIKSLQDELAGKDQERLRIIDEYSKVLSILRKEKNDVMLSTVRTESKLCNNKIKSEENEDKFFCHLIIEKYRDKEQFNKLASLIDEISGGIIDFLRHKTDLKEEDINVVILDICGFDYKSIGAILSISSTLASTRKSRVKNKFNNLPSKETQNWLSGFIPMFRKKDEN